MTTLHVVTGGSPHALSDSQYRWMLDRELISEQQIRRELHGFCSCGIAWDSRYHETSTCGRKKPLKAAVAPAQPWEQAA